MSKRDRGERFRCVYISLVDLIPPKFCNEITIVTHFILAF